MTTTHIYFYSAGEQISPSVAWQTEMRTYPTLANTIIAVSQHPAKERQLNFTRARYSQGGLFRFFMGREGFYIYTGYFQNSRFRRNYMQGILFIKIYLKLY